MQDKFEFKVSFDAEAAKQALHETVPRDNRDENWARRIGAAVEAGVKIEAVAPVVNITVPQVNINGEVDAEGFMAAVDQAMRKTDQSIRNVPLSQTNIPEGWALVPKDIEQAMMDLQTRHDEALDNVKTLQEHSARQMKAINEANAQKEDYKQRLSELIECRDAWATDAPGLRAQIEKLTTDYQNMMAARDQVAKSRDQLADELEGAHAERRRLSGEVDGLAVEAASTRAELTKALNARDMHWNEVKRLQGRVQVRIKEGDELRAENSRLRDKIRTLEEKHNRLQAGIELRVLREKVDAFEHQAVASGKRISELERNHRINEAMIKDRDESIEIQAKLIGDLEGKVSQCGDVIDAQVDVIKTQTTKISDLEDKIAMHEASNIQLRDFNTRAVAARKEAEDKLALAGDAPAQVKVLSAAIEGLQAKLDGKGLTINKLVNDRNVALKQRDELQVRLSAVADAMKG